MIQRLTQAIVEYGVISGRIKREDIEVYMYGYTLLLETSICIVLTGCIGLLFNSLIEVMVFSIIFIPLRSFGGGIHASKDWQCLLVSMSVIIGYCILLKIDYMAYLYQFFLLFSVIGMFFSQKNLKTIRYGKVMTSKSIVNLICIICIVLSAILFKAEQESLAEGVLITLFIWLMSFFANEYLQKKI